MPSRKCAALPAIDILSWHDLNRRSIVSLCPALKRATIFIGFDIKGRLKHTTSKQASFAAFLDKQNSKPHNSKITRQPATG
jgi:hypothetical protein